MSAGNSEYVTESGRRDSAYSPQPMQGPSFASLEAQQIQPVLQDWSHDSSDTAGINLAVQAYSFPEGPASVPRSLPTDSSSMALTMQSLSAYGPSLADSLPSLGSFPSIDSMPSIRSSAAESAVRAGFIDPEGNLARSADAESLSEIYGSPVVQQPKGPRCLFSFLQCNKTFTSPREWYEHSKSHFRGATPPRELRCPYPSCSRTIVGDDGEQAWSKRWEHFERDHNILAESEGVCEKRDVRLFEHLWNAGVIGRAELQELRRFGQLGSDTRPFVTEERSERRDRRRGKPMPNRSGDGPRRH